MLTGFRIISALAAGQGLPDEEALQPDTVPVDGISVLSEGEETPYTFIHGVIPPTPQAAALARYGEHPVDISTGLVDISVPVYTIRMGGFEMPVSLSYHASGIRVTDMSTPVGLGWSLIAGGAISRTISGVEDPKSYPDDEDYKYRNVDEIAKLVEAGRLDILEQIAHRRPGQGDMYNIESDRYTYSIPGQAGVIRYNHKTHEFVPLNHNNLVVERIGGGTDISFWIMDSNGCEYEFDVPARTGCSDEGIPPVTSWYLSKVTTPWGTVVLKYESAPIYSQRFTSADGYVGERYETGTATTGSPGENLLYSATSYDEVHSELYYHEQLLKSIEWDGGNKVTFQYSNTRDYRDAFGYLLKLPNLDRITVSNSNGEIIDTFTLTHTEWGNCVENRRTLLTEVSSTKDGRYTFSYNRQSYLPKYNTSSGSPWDYWGYYNGNDSRCMQSREVMDDAIAEYKRRNYNAVFRHTTEDFARRTPDEALAKTGMLTKITYPTGGASMFDYELHRTALEIYGGLRIAKITTYDGANVVSTKEYRYEGIENQPHPRYLMSSHAYVPYTFTSGFPTIMDRINVTSSFFTPSGLGMGCPLMYTKVEETLNGSIRTSTEFILSQHAHEYPSNFDHYEIHYLPPQIQEFALTDEGNIRSLPVRIVTTDLNSGRRLSERLLTYDLRTVDSFSPGVAVAKTTPFDLHYGYTSASSFCVGPYFYYRELTCLVTASNLVSEETIDHTTGVSTLTTYEYDESGYCVDHPRRVRTTLSDGREMTTEYEYTGDLRDQQSVSLFNNFNYTDGIRSAVTSVGESEVSRSRIDYDTSCGLPSVRHTSVGGGPLVERERVLAYNSSGRPLTVVTERADTTAIEWNNGVELRAVTAPGGLRTAYTTSPLIGVTGVLAPNGTRNSYGYGDGGRLTSVSDNRGLLRSYSYSISSRAGQDENSVTATTRVSDAPAREVTRKEYYDGLGRPVLAADNSSSVSGNFVYTATRYDAMGRVSATSLGAVGSTSASLLSDASLRSLLSSTYTADTAVWSRVTYDALGRQLFVTTPGNAWAAKDKGVRTEYITNGAGDVRLYHAPMESTSLVKSGFYEAGTLRGERTTDEDGVTLTVFTDLSGRRVLERRGTGNDTYFVYDDAGQLRFILSPEYQEHGYRDKYAYEYRYDSLGRVVKSFVPGCGYTQNWYDRAGRMLFTQDGRLRAQGLHRFILYDRAGRPCVQGTTRKCTRSSAVNPVTLSSQSNAMGGYVPSDRGRVTVDRLESVTYYDSYAFMSLYGYSVPQEAAAAASCAMGLPTGVWSRLSDGSEMLEVTAYDNLGNVCFSKVYGPYGHESATQTAYHYSGQPSSVSYSEGGVAYTLANTYTGQNCALSESRLTINGASHLLCRNGYDNFGRITKVERGLQGGTSAYTYDLAGRLTYITHDGGFTQTLHYADGPGTPRYDGMVSAMSWKTGPGETRLRGYMYEYDELGRLTGAVYGENTTLKSNPNRYTERVLEYTANGNIRRFQRHGLKDDGVYGKIDNLHLTYDGNQLKSVLDDAEAVTRYATADFADLTDSSTEYSYDECGAMTSDTNQGILSISYDDLGNPRLTQFSNGAQTEYVYTPSGEKVREIHRTPRSVTIGGTLPAPHEMNADTTDYVGPVIYRGGRPDMVRYAGGYASLGKSGTKYAPTFYHYIADYLGNNRAVVRASTGEMVQVTNYYAWGSVYGDMGTGASLQPYKYGDKELDLTAGVARYDYAARAYYAAIPRFDRPDALAGKYPHHSPYIFCANNPVNVVDPDGNDWYTNGDDVIWTPYQSQSELDKNNISGKYLGTAHVEFTGSRNEKLGTKNGQYGYIDGEGAVVARVIVYGPKGPDDIHAMTGYTMTSDAEAFGPIDEGLYPANYDSTGKSGGLKSHWVLNHRGKIRTMDGKINPNAPSQIDTNGEGYKDGIFIHSTNSNGTATGEVSKGCLLIAPNDFPRFNEIMKGVKNFTVQVSRFVTVKQCVFPSDIIYRQILKKD